MSPHQLLAIEVIDDREESSVLPRCEKKLEYVGTKQFHERDNWGVIGNIREFLVDEVSLDMYVCPECGHVELFADRIGREFRPR